MDLKVYQESPALGQSKLKTLLIHPINFTQEVEQKLYYEEKESFTIGSAVDCIMTRGDIQFEKEYYVSELQEKPSDTIKSIIQMTFDSVEVPAAQIAPMAEFQADILKACIAHDYQRNYKEQTKIDKILEYQSYWNELCLAKGKILLSKDEKTVIDAIVMSLVTNPVTADWFVSQPYNSILRQEALFFTINGVECKALLDMIYINHRDKTITPIDIKTTVMYTTDFPKAVRRYRYDIQAAWYTEACMQSYAAIYPDYTIKPFVFIVESTTLQGTPLVYTCSSELLQIGKSGRAKKVLADGTLLSYAIVGYMELLSDYQFYTIQGFTKKREVIENESNFILDWNS